MVKREKLKYDPDEITHPGETLRSAMKAEGYDVEEMARILRCKSFIVRDVLNGDYSVTPAMAECLESAGIGTTQFWKARQARYDEAHPDSTRQGIWNGPEEQRDAHRWAEEVLSVPDRRISTTLEEVMDVLETWMLKGQWGKCDAVFKQWLDMLDETATRLALVIGALSVTYGARSKIPHRQEFLEKVEEQLNKMMKPDESKMHLQGLK